MLLSSTATDLGANVNKPKSPVQACLNEPILFRTSTESVYRAALSEGSIWLRSAQYFRELEDAIRNDLGEGINSGTTSIPLRIAAPGAPELEVSGHGRIGQEIVPHYILSLHGSSIFPSQRMAFGGWTFGVKSLSGLSAEIVFRVSLQLPVEGYRYGQVYYQYACLAQSHSCVGSAAINISATPPLYLNPLNTDVLRKLPIAPFVEQDEWRIAVFTRGYLDQDATAPLQITVDPSHFYPYLEPS